jgi:ribosomal protein S18 acetylase RimI-like enzyme
VSPFRVRPARRRDADAIARLAGQFTADEGGGKDPMSAAAILRHGFGARRVFWILVAARGADILGYALIYKGYDAGESSVGLHLSDLFVRADARRQGIGHALMDAVAAETKRVGGVWYTWFVLKTNAEGQAFYARFGSKEIPSLPLYIEV